MREAFARLPKRARDFVVWYYSRPEVRSVPIQNRLLTRWWVSESAARDNLRALNARGLIKVSGGYIYPVEGVVELIGELEGEDDWRQCPRCGGSGRVKKEAGSGVVDKVFRSPFRRDE